MTSFKVLGGTRPDVDLCTTCAAVIIVKGSALSQEMRMCRALGLRITARVAECSEFSDDKEKGVRAYDRMAWHLDFDNKGPVFVSPAERNRSHGRITISYRRKRRVRKNPAPSVNGMVQ